jgi:hypothetical protein
VIHMCEKEKANQADETPKERKERLDEDEGNK